MTQEKTRPYGRIILRRPGAPEAMEWVEDALPPPGPGEVLLRHEAIGVDFIDTNIRSGLMPVPLPTGIGFAAVGRVMATGAQVEDIAAGDRVAYSWSVPGSYAEARIVPAQRLIPLRDPALSSQVAAAALFRGLTAWYLATRLRPIQPGEHVLVHAAAGGVGMILTQWLAHLGAVVIGTAGSAEKVALLRAAGCTHALRQDEDFVGLVREVTGGKGCAVVYDSVGRDTFERSLDCAARFGLVVSYGWASGDPDPVALATLRNKGSLFLTRPTVSHYTEDPADLRAGAEALFSLIAQGRINIRVGNTYPLREAAAAHRDLTGRRTTGSVILTV